MIRFPRSTWDAMRARYAQGENAAALAREYGMSVHHVWQRSSREKWRLDRGLPPQPTQADHHGAFVHQVRRADDALAAGIVRRRCQACFQLTPADPCTRCGAVLSLAER